jgi:UDP-N-acetylmuramoylalanine--D-glutamate ligase
MAVFLNFSRDHLDRHSSERTYQDAKLRIFANQRASDVAIVNEAIAGLPGVPADAICFGTGDHCQMRLDGEQLMWRDEPLIDVAEVRLRGRHNLDNAMAAAAVCLARGLGLNAVRSTLRDFTAGPHRMELVAETGGVAYINDSKATNAAAAAAAIESYESGVHVILGGSKKGTGFGELAPAVAARCAGCYLIGEAAGEIEDALRSTGVAVEVCGDLERAVTRAAERAHSGEVVLLAPAAASFDQYRDFEERGEHFRALVRAL